jgi:hypothetical protein
MHDIAIRGGTILDRTDAMEFAGSAAIDGDACLKPAVTPGQTGARSMPRSAPTAWCTPGVGLRGTEGPTGFARLIRELTTSCRQIEGHGWLNAC